MRLTSLEIDMEFTVIVHARLQAQFEHWAKDFDAADAARAANGVTTLFRHPVIGEQAVVFAMRTRSPRQVHDMMYHPDIRPGIEASGLVVGSESITICEAGL